MKRAAAQALLALAAACGEQSASPEAPAAATPDVPASMRACAECHASVVRDYLAHGMAASLGPLATAPTGEWTDPHRGTRYVFGADAAGPTLTALAADGGRRVQRVVGQIGAGVHDTSYVGTEIDPLGRPTGRLAFLPVERLADGTLAPAPFEELGGRGFDQPVTAECLECHTTDDPSGGDGPTYPRNALGVDALQRLAPLDCAACHGPTARHVDIMQERVAAAPDDLGLPRLAALPAGAQRDVCARCHLDGEARVALEPLSGYGPRERPLHAERPVLVPAAPDDDFRFVAQLDRLVLSACFEASPALTCTSCHAPHRSVAAQGPAAFDAACQQCHATDACVRPPQLRVDEVTGAPARTADGCVDCHVRRSQPYDLAGVRTADHWVRRRIPLPATAPVRAQHGGAPAVFDDGRLAAALGTGDGARWAQALSAIGWWRLGQPERALQELARATPGGSLPRPSGLARLQESATFHHLRGLLLEEAGRTDEARQAYDLALALDPALPEARVNRGALRLAAGDLEGARADALELQRRWPAAESAWNLLARVQARAGDLPAAADALVQSTLRWPSDAGVWHELGRLYLATGRPELARAAFAQAAVLQPSRPGLRADQQAAGAR